MGQAKGAGGQGAWGRPPQLPPRDCQCPGPWLASDGVWQTPPHRGLSPAPPLLADPQLAAGRSQTALGPGARADLC